MNDPRDFDRFWVGQTLSGLGDAFSIVAVPLMALEATRSVERMGLLTALAAAAHVTAGLVAGAVAARVERRRLMVACDLLRAALWLGLAVVWRVRGPGFAPLAVVAALSAFAGNLFQVEAVSAVPRLVAPERLAAANGRLQGGYAAMFFLGPWAAGELCERFGASVGVAVDALSFLASAASLVAVRGELADAPRTSREEVPTLPAAVRFLWGNRRLRALTLLLAASSFLLASRENLLVYFIKNTLRAGDSAVGRVFAVASLGAIAGAALARWSRSRVGFAASWTGAGVLVGAALAAVSAVESRPALGACVFVVALGDSVRSVNALTLQQQSVPARLLGPVTAASQVLLTVPAVAGAWASAAFAATFDEGATLAATGVLLVGLMGVGLFTPLRDAGGRVQGFRGSVV
jgi:MFS family permease